MDLAEIKLRQLAGQHLLSPADTGTVAKDLCGVQAQYLTHALHGLAIRCDQVDSVSLVKSWTIRGTMHIFHKEDLPLFLHEGRRHFLRPVDTMESDTYITAQRKAYFAERIMEAIAEGIHERDALKAVCAEAGMTETESKSLFDPWGGTLRALCESGRICHKVLEKKAFELCPPFEPMEKAVAERELMRRYFTNFGPATIKDAAYFFGMTQSEIRGYLAQLPVREFTCGGEIYFYLAAGRNICGDLPSCLLLAGFDQLMLGYEKTKSLFLPQEYRREIFGAGGTVRPALLLHGQVAGFWNRKNRRLKITLFAPADRRSIEETARTQWKDLKEIELMSL